MDPLALIDGLIARAPAMRAAGILTIALGDVSLTLAESQPEAAPSKQKDDPVPRNVFEDPTAYGLPPGSKVPGFEPPPGWAAPPEGAD